MNTTKEAVRPLTPQQTKILALIAKGHSDREIANRLSIRGCTLYGHIHAIKVKTGIHSRVLLAFYALGKGFVTQDDIRAAIKRDKRQV